jgi:hypothetical protein
MPGFSYLLCFFFYKIRKQEGGTGSVQRWEGMGGLLTPGVGGNRERGRRIIMVQIMYTYACKCKNDTC